MNEPAVKQIVLASRPPYLTCSYRSKQVKCPNDLAHAKADLGRGTVRPMPWRRKRQN
jgi:hypothetical protein